MPAVKPDDSRKFDLQLTRANAIRVAHYIAGVNGSIKKKADTAWTDTFNDIFQTNVSRSTLNRWRNTLLDLIASVGFTSNYFDICTAAGNARREQGDVGELADPVLRDVEKGLNKLDHVALRARLHCVEKGGNPFRRPESVLVERGG